MMVANLKFKHKEWKNVSIWQYRKRKEGKEKWSEEQEEEDRSGDEKVLEFTKGVKDLFWGSNVHPTVLDIIN